MSVMFIHHTILNSIDLKCVYSCYVCGHWIADHVLFFFFFFSIFNALFSFAYIFYAHQSFDFVIKWPWAMKPRAVNPGIFSSLAAPRLSATYENKGVMTNFSKKLSFFRLSNLMSLASWQLSVFKEESDIWLYFVRCNKNSQFYLLQPYPIDILNRDKAR